MFSIEFHDCNIRRLASGSSISLIIFHQKRNSGYYLDCAKYLGLSREPLAKVQPLYTVLFI